MAQVLYSTFSAFFAALVTWFFSRKGIEIENEAKSALFYQNLLDDATKRINQCLEIIENLNTKVTERDKIIERQEIEKQQLQHHIKELMDSNESLINEMRKFKQLNGKSQ
jgi:hypothetical protein